MSIVLGLFFPTNDVDAGPSKGILLPAVALGFTLGSPLGLGLWRVVQEAEALALSALPCNIPGIMACRTIDSARQRLLLSLLVPLVPCSAKLVVLATPAAMGVIYNVPLTDLPAVLRAGVSAAGAVAFMCAQSLFLPCVATLGMIYKETRSLRVFFFICSTRSRCPSRPPWRCIRRRGCCRPVVRGICGGGLRCAGYLSGMRNGHRGSAGRRTLRRGAAKRIEDQGERA